MTKLAFGSCEICGGSHWTPTYSGRVRIGTFGKFEPGVVARCGTCGIDRLEERLCVRSADYESEAYRLSLAQTPKPEEFFAEHDALQIHSIGALWPLSVRGKTIVDIGCAGGSWLDHVSALAERCIAIEPAQQYRKSLESRGYSVYRWTDEAVKAEGGQVDFATCFQVIEHVESPRELLTCIANLLEKGGKAVISTPNREDLLLDVVGDDYKSFFYRAAHRWYFDVESLDNCARRAGLRRVGLRHVQRYDMSNFALWLRDRRPSGLGRITALNDRRLNAAWTTFLEESGRADTMYLTYERG